jgi:hypothetical protein
MLRGFSNFFGMRLMCLKIIKYNLVILRGIFLLHYQNDANLAVFFATNLRLVRGNERNLGSILHFVLARILMGQEPI